MFYHLCRFPSRYSSYFEGDTSLLTRHSTIRRGFSFSPKVSFEGKWPTSNILTLCYLLSIVVWFDFNHTKHSFTPDSPEQRGGEGEWPTGCGKQRNQPSSVLERETSGLPTIQLPPAPLQQASPTSHRFWEIQLKESINRSFGARWQIYTFLCLWCLTF